MKKKIIKIFEVSARDGLQNEKVISTFHKLNLIDNLKKSNLKNIETTSFVKLPSMSDHKEIVKSLPDEDDVNYSVLTLNMNGLRKAVDLKVKNIGLVVSPSDSFCQKNMGKNKFNLLNHVEEMTEFAKKNNCNIRGYISTVIACPYEGSINPKQITDLAKQLDNLGCNQISLGDTIGIGTPGCIKRMLSSVLREVDPNKIAGHYHNTYGQALANVLMSLDMGISTFDSSVAGLGGCPFAPGSTGNLSTEELVYMLHGLGYETGLDLDKLIYAGDVISQVLNKENNSLVSRSRLVTKNDKKLIIIFIVIKKKNIKKEI